METFDTEPNTARSSNAPLDVRPIPRISIQAFCETDTVSSTIQECADDRRMARAHVKVHMGGLRAAVEFYESAPTPNIIMVESQHKGDDIISELDDLASVCDADTRVIVIGHRNDVDLYRKLIRFGVSEYMVAPVDVLDVIDTIGGLFASPDAEPLGRTIAFIGGKGGVGSSVLCHNIAWSIASKFESDVILADYDLASGTVALDFNQDPPQGIAEAIYTPERLDETYLDRILSKCSERLSLLAAPASLDRTYDFPENTFDVVTELCQGLAPNIVLDLPFQWSGWVKNTIITSDELVITVTPDLTNLRNAKNFVDNLKQERKHDAPPRIILNQVGRSKETEITKAAFEEAIEMEVCASISYEPKLFGTASNNGQMIVETDAKHAIVSEFDQVAALITGKIEQKAQKRTPMVPFLSKLRSKKSA